MGAYKFIPITTSYAMKIMINRTIRIDHLDFRPPVLLLDLKSIGSIAGCLVGAFKIIDFTSSRQSSLYLILAVMVASIALPFCTVRETLAIVLFVIGMFIGFFETVANTLVLGLWGDDCNIYMMCIHGFKSFGTFIAASFLNMTKENFQSEDETPSIKDITVYFSIIYGVLASLVLLSTLSWIGLYHLVPAKYRMTQRIGNKCEVPSDFKYRMFFVITTLLLAFLMATIYPELADILIKLKRSTEDETASFSDKNIIILFWGCHFVGRLISIFLAHRNFTSIQMIVLGLFTEVCAAVALLMYSYVEKSLLWFATIVLGIGTAPILPATLVWYNILFHADNRFTATFFAMLYTGEITFSRLINYHYKQNIDRSRIVLLSPIAYAVIASIQLIVYKIKKSSRHRQDTENQRQHTDIVDRSMYSQTTSPSTASSANHKSPKDISQQGQDALQNIDKVKSRLSQHNKENLAFLRQLEDSTSSTVKKKSQKD